METQSRWNDGERRPVGRGVEVEPATSEATARAVYAQVTDPEGAVPGGALLEELAAEMRELPANGAELPDAATTQRLAAQWASEERDRYLTLLERTRDAEDRAVLVRRAVLGCAPLSLLSGAWLQWITSGGNADDPLVLRVLAIYASDLGVGQPRASRGSAFLALLRQLNLSEHAVPAGRLALDQRIADGSFRLPAVLLAMSRRPDDFRPEILGADLCLRRIGLPPPLAIARAELPHGQDWVAIDPGAARDLEQPAPADVCGGLVGATPDVSWDRVSVGFRFALAAVQRWCEDLRDDLDAARDPAHEMAELLGRRAREGAIYHRTYELDDRPLSDWLQEARVDPWPMLDALAASRLVKPGRSGSSALVNSLVGERGPMFRIFAPEDLAVVRRWIDSLPRSGGTRVGPARPASAATPPLRLPSIGVHLDQGRPPATLREAYHLLLRRVETPALRRFALDYVRGWLARSAHRIDAVDGQLPRNWGREGLRPWLAEQHDRHNFDFESESEAPMPSRDELIDSTVQLAPLTLIDGSWLQGFTDYELASSEVGYFLFETYWDELGNGEPRLNHPLIYREVLAEMGIGLPPTAAREFPEWPGFRDGSFELPVYWLSIGRFPRTFMPEILGLNVAMELSGVGGTYRSARRALAHHGFSTRFVDIHNTIDNVAAGHSAWAADAVDAYLSAMVMAQGPGAQADTWLRVRVGYRSLNPPAGFWARRAGLWALLRALRSQ
jgi:Iron-containing redox enzyme